jgi:tetratricopeptide (TPR) repeat protein
VLADGPAWLMLIQAQVTSVQANDRAVQLFREGRLDDAIAELRRGLAVNPDYATGYSNLGFLYLWKGQCDQAVECLLRALEVDPRHRDAPDHLVDVLHTLIDELVQIGLGDGFLSPQPGEKFDHYNRHRRTREIGALIAMMGDRGAVTMDGRALPRAQLMTLVIHCVGKKMKDYRTSHNLKFAWNGMNGEGQTPHV